jgi:SAM-dependent methyltransferase
MRLTEIVHETLSKHLQAGDLAIDATAGNGHDTCFLAERVGLSGRVIAIDIQEDALAETRLRIDAAGLEARVELVCADHTAYLNTLAKAKAGGAAAVLFNLGYLPGGDKSIKTVAGGTQPAMDSALQLLRPGGLLCVTAYRGHPDGPEEAAAVEAWMQAQAALGNFVENHVPASKNRPPVLWLLKKALKTEEA